MTHCSQATLLTAKYTYNVLPLFVKQTNILPVIQFNTNQIEVKKDHNNDLKKNRLWPHQF